MTENKCNIQPDNLNKQLRSEVLKYLVILSGSIVLTATAFYFNTRNSLSTHEQQLVQLQRQIEAKADQGAVEKRLDRIENKIDDLINFQINQKNR